MTAKLQANRVRRMYLGGGRIDAFCGVPVDVSDGVPRPEDWLASTTQAFNGVCEIEGEGLGRLEDGRLVKDAIGDLPCLVKLLDSDERLVIQAHPTVPCAKRLFGSPVGKTECWYFLPGTADDACVYLGFKPGITREKWKKAVCASVNCDLPLANNRERLLSVNNDILSFLHRVPVASGDFVFVNGGVPHAIGAGCFMVELQEPSDLMVVAERFTPSGRRIPDGKIFCGLDLEGMLDVYGYEGLSFEDACAKYVRKCSQMPIGHKSQLATNANAVCICGSDFTDKFSMWRMSGGGTLPLDGKGAVAVVTDGAGEVNGLAVKKGDRLVVTGEAAVATRGNAAFVVCA